MMNVVCVAPSRHSNSGMLCVHGARGEEQLLVCVNDMLTAFMSSAGHLAQSNTPTRDLGAAHVYLPDDAQTITHERSFKSFATCKAHDHGAADHVWHRASQTCVSAAQHEQQARHGLGRAAASG